MNQYEYASFPPSALLNPAPAVLVSCAEKDHPENRNMITLAWAGTVNSEPPMVSVSIRKERYSHGLVLGSGEFVVNLVDEAMCRAVSQTFRAVVMVIVASGLGMLPIALSTGIGAVNRIGIGAASVGGILVAGALTLVVLPFVSMALARGKSAPRA